MNFYPHHIGDFNNATRHLTRVEQSVYRSLIELQYDTENALTTDFEKLAKRVLCVSDDEKTALKTVLGEFFTLNDIGYENERCMAEIDKYRANTSAKARAGIASAAARQHNRTRVEQSVNEIQLTNNQEPITKNHIKGTYVPLCPQQKIKDLYNEKLSMWLPSIKIMTGARAKQLQLRWKFLLTQTRDDGTRYATTEEEGLKKFSEFFDRVAESDFLCGRVEGKSWTADIDFLIKPVYFVKVIEGKFSNRGVK